MEEIKLDLLMGYWTGKLKDSTYKNKVSVTWFPALVFLGN